MEEFNKAASKGIRMKLLYIHHLSLLRPDGHPGLYMKFHPFDKDKNAKVQNDCLHWCLPGPVDTWNDLMLEMLISEGYTTASLKDRSIHCSHGVKTMYVNLLDFSCAYAIIYSVVVRLQSKSIYLWKKFSFFR